MEMFSKALSKTTKGIMESITIKMETSTKVIGTTISRMASGCYDLPTVSLMMVSFLKVKSTAKESIYGQMEMSTSVSSKMIREMGWGHINGDKEEITVVNGRETE